MKNYKVLLMATFSLLTSSLFAQSFDIDTAPLYNDIYECELDGGEMMKIHLHHKRITEATVEVFGQTFFGLGTFYDKIVVSDKSANYDEAKTLHIFKKDYYGLPLSVDVHTAQTRAPYNYKLDCQKL